MFVHECLIYTPSGSAGNCQVLEGFWGPGKATIASVGGPRKAQIVILGSGGPRKAKMGAEEQPM